jgi:hypothetical protein
MTRDQHRQQKKNKIIKQLKKKNAVHQKAPATKSKAIKQKIKKHLPALKNIKKKKM